MKRDPRGVFCGLLLQIHRLHDTGHSIEKLCRHARHIGMGRKVFPLWISDVRSQSNIELLRARFLVRDKCVDLLRTEQVFENQKPIPAVG